MDLQHRALRAIPVRTTLRQRQPVLSSRALRFAVCWEDFAHPHRPSEYSFGGLEVRQAALSSLISCANVTLKTFLILWYKQSKIKKLFQNRLSENERRQ